MLRITGLLALAAVSTISVAAQNSPGAPKAAKSTAQDVNVVNTNAEAVPTKDQFNLALATPVSFTDSFTMGPNIFGGESNYYQVPANRKLVIQYISMRCDLAGSADALGMVSSDQNLPPGNTTFLGIFIPMRSVPYPATGAGHVLSVGGTPVTVIFDPGKVVQLGAYRTNGTDTAFCFGGFTGYLVAVP